jgi:hypothetical protein
MAAGIEEDPIDNILTEACRRLEGGRQGAGRDSELAFDFILSARRSHLIEALAAFLTPNLVALEKCIPMSAAQEINMLAFDRGGVSS